MGGEGKEGVNGIVGKAKVNQGGKVCKAVKSANAVPSLKKMTS